MKLNSSINYAQSDKESSSVKIWPWPGPKNKEKTKVQEEIENNKKALRKINRSFRKRKKVVIWYFEWEDVLSQIKKNLKLIPENINKSDIEIEWDAYLIQESAIQSIRSVSFSISWKNKTALWSYTPSEHHIRIYENQFISWWVSNNNIDWLLSKIEKTIEHELIHSSLLDGHIVNTIILDKYTDYDLMKSKLKKKYGYKSKGAGIYEGNIDDLLIWAEIGTIIDSTAYEKQLKNTQYHLNKKELNVRAKMLKEELKRQWLSVDISWIQIIYSKIKSGEMDAEIYGDLKEIIENYEWQLENLWEVINWITEIDNSPNNDVYYS